MAHIEYSQLTNTEKEALAPYKIRVASAMAMKVNGETREVAVIPEEELAKIPSDLLQRIRDRLRGQLGSASSRQ